MFLVNLFMYLILLEWINFFTNLNVFSFETYKLECKLHTNAQAMRNQLNKREEEVGVTRRERTCTTWESKFKADIVLNETKTEMKFERKKIKQGTMEQICEKSMSLNACFVCWYYQICAALVLFSPLIYHVMTYNALALGVGH